MKEFYNLSELALNEAEESWGNLGYWENAHSYSDACRSLARLLADKMQLNAQSRVMDLGFGCGDQLVLWSKAYGVEDIRGINYSLSQTSLAQATLNTQGFVHLVDKLKVGCASDVSLWQALDALSGKSNQGINRVLALDCAYHFSNKARFFALAHQGLISGGRIGLTDFVWAGDRLPISARLKTDAMLALSRITRRNMVSTDKYAEQLEQAGFRNIELIDISEFVMPQFKHWLRHFSTSQRFKSLPLSSRLKYRTTANFLDWAYANKVLKYVLVSAGKA